MTNPHVRGERAGLGDGSDGHAPTIVIVGAGLGGCLLAVFLGRAGHRVRMLERRADPRVAGAEGGRSINLAISARGLHALDRAGLKERLLERGLPMPGRMIHEPDGATVFQSYSADGTSAINSVSRSELNLLLLEAADACDSVTIDFEQRCLDVDLDAPSVTVEDANSGEVRTIAGDLVVGADGAYSAIRARLQKTINFDYEQKWLAHGYKELHIPPVETGEHAPFAMEPKALHIWPRGGSMMIALPNLDGSFTCTLFWPYEGDHGFDTVMPENVEAFFGRHYPDVPKLMPTLREDFEANPVGPLVTVRCDPWQRDGKVVLLGDAAHAVVPFYGQGANASFEDCEALFNAIEHHPRDLVAACREYEAQRVRHANAIADLALANFIEMRDHTGRLWFRAKKRIEHVLARFVPGFLPLYDMISFTTIPYDDARRRAARQWRTVGWVAAALLAVLLLVAIVVIVAMTSR